MTLFATISFEARGERWQLIIAASVAGAANALLLATIRAVTNSPEARDVPTLLRFVLLVASFILFTRYVNHRTMVLIESVLHRIKVRVGDQIAQAELSALERVGAAEICDRITENTTFISEKAGIIASLMQSLIVLAFSVVYIASISLPAAALVALLCAAGAARFVIARKDFVAYTQRSGRLRITFLEGLSDLLNGFKEIQFSRRRGRELGEHIMQSAAALSDVEIRSNNLVADGMIIGEVVLFSLLAAVVYALRLCVQLDSPTLIHLVATVMFVWGPFQRVTSGIVPYQRSNLALSQIDALTKKLMAATDRQVPAVALEDPWRGRLRSIEARGIEYSYFADDSEDVFHIGPIDLTIEAGQVLFIVGGNGSGKSTLLKVLTGLYLPSHGTLGVDGIIVHNENVGAYRNLISAIFSDFHLFPKLYGFVGVDEAAVQKLLVLMQLEQKTSLVNRAFTKLTLSTGQKKRLAMIVSLLEDRPICVFDEWAADQDPEFRQYFYKELLPRLRQEGKVVIVVSHDDRYFHCADRVITMEYGLIRSVKDPRPSVAAT